MPANRPDAAEIAAAVREFLELDIKTLLQTAAMNTGSPPAANNNQDNGAQLGRLSLHTAIAINLLRLLEREANLRAAQQQQEQLLLQGFLAIDGDANTVNANALHVNELNVDELNDVLIGRIESGACDQQLKPLLGLLLQISLAKIGIDNPSYSTVKKYRTVNKELPL